MDCSDDFLALLNPPLPEKGLSMKLHLPDEILLIIIDHLDLKTLEMFAMTCEKIFDLCFLPLAISQTINLIYMSI